MAKLARGDIGDLFLARSLGAGGFEKLVIIKRIHAEFMRDPAIAEMFMAEARTAARIEHPNVRMVYEIGQAQAHYYIALEYLEGVPLVEILLGRRHEKRLADTRLVSALLVQTCQGLHMAHTLPGLAGGLVHGDLNPRSIFVTASGTAKILDFDIVEMRGALAERHGFVRRTSAYMSPEEVRTGQCDLRSDIFSMGVVAWEALTGRRLFKQNTRERTMQAIDRGRIPNPQKYRPELSDAVSATIMRALNRDPTLRFQTARDFGTALERTVQAEGPPLTPVNIASLIENAFATRLRQQREFVRAARNGEAIAPKARHQAREEAVTVLAPEVLDPDDWNPDTDAATRVAPDIAVLLREASRAQDANDPENFGATIEDPFNEIAASADYSGQSEAPQWTDTRNLVLSELGLDVDDDPETGAVDIDVSDDSFDSYGLSTLEDDSGRSADAAGVGMPLRAAPSAQPYIQSPVWQSPVWPATQGATLPRRPSTIDSDRGFPRVPSTIDPSNAGRLGTLDSLGRGSSATEAATRPRPKGRRLGRYMLLAVLLGVGTAGYLLFEAQKQADSVQVSVPAATLKTTAEPDRAPPKNTGAGAAASILAAAGTGSETGTGSGTGTGTGTGSGTGTETETETETGTENENGNGNGTETGTETETETETGTETGTEAETERLASERRKSEQRKSERRKREAQARGRRQKQGDTAPAVERKATRSTGNGPGYFTVNASPYATVFVDGKKVGITPIVKLKLRAGKHNVKLVSSEGGKSSAMSITIQSEEVVRKNVNF